ncbi:MAG: hypothetical protein U9O97_01710 [Elusimicrobiota bacterium]|nr:hypothetical protein [Elusimicrobiota bacterium]
MGTVPITVIGTVPISAAGEVRIPDMNVLGKDLSLYGVGAVTASGLPGRDKERFLSDLYFKSGFYKAPRSGKSFVCLLDGGSAASASGKAAFLNRSRKRDSGFRAAADAGFSGKEGRGRLLWEVDLLYKQNGAWNLFSDPRFSGRNYELPASAGAHIRETLSILPVSFYSQTANSFISFSAEKLLMSGSYPAGFYLSGGETSFSSGRFSASIDSSGRDISVNAKTSLSRENWDWADGEKRFSSFSADCSFVKKFNRFDLDAGFKFVKWAGDAHTAGKALVSFPVFGGSLTAGIDAGIKAPRIEDIFSRRGSILESFPGAAHGGLNNLKAEYILSLFPAGVKVSVARSDTHNFLYADEGASSPGSFRSSRYKRYEAVAFLSLLSGPFTSGLRFCYTGAENFLPVPRSGVSVFSGYEKGALALNVLVGSVSKGPWTDSFVNGLVKICYNLPSETVLFLGAENVFGEKVFIAPGNLPVSPYEWRDTAFFSAGVEIKLGG